MGCDALNNAPRPNPKDPAINVCTPQAISKDDIDEGKDLTLAIVNAKYYCNDETNNPNLINGFGSLSFQAQQDPAQYGTQLYKQILATLDRNMSTSVATGQNDYNTRGNQYTLIGLGSGGVVSGTILLYVIPQIVAKITSTIGDSTLALVAKYLIRFALNPSKVLSELAIKLGKKGVSLLASGGKKLLGKLSNTTEGTDPEELSQNPAFDGEVGDVPAPEAEAGAEAGAEDAAEAVIDSVPGLDIIGIAATAAAILYSVTEGAIDAIGKSTESYETAFCNNIGDRYEQDQLTDTEWTVLDNDYQEGSCHFNDGTRGYQVSASAGCCNGACSIVGSGLRCVRQNFRADPFVCCFNDYACNSDNDPDTCFQTPDRQRTCHPLFRDLSTNYCRDIIYDYCSGDELLPTQNDWLEMWLEDSFVQINSKMAVSNLTSIGGHYNQPENINLRGLKYPLDQKQPCLRAIARAITTSKVCTWEQLQEINVVEGTINSEGFVWSKNLINKVFQRYIDEGGSFLGGINTDGLNRDSSFYNTMWKICSQIPGLCTEALNNMCSSYTADDVSTSPFLLPWCSCYLPDSEYQQYEAFGINRECSPLCNRTGVIPSVSATGQSNICQQTVCVLDQTTVNLINTTFDGGQINFNQVCGSCGSSNVKQYYDFGNISVNLDPDTDFILDPPELNASGQYTQVYGSGFNLSQSNTAQAESLILTESDYNNYSNLTDVTNYYKCILQYATSVTNNTVGVVSIVILSPDPENNPTPLKTNTEYYLGISEGLNPLFDNNGSPAVAQLLKTGITGSTVVSHNSTTYGQAGYQASVNACQCITSGLSLKAINSEISGTINFDQNCGSTQCFNDSGQPIPCSSTQETYSTTNTIENLQEEVIDELRKNRVFTMFFIILGLFIVLLLFYSYRYFSRTCYKVLDILVKIFTQKLKPETSQ